MRENFDKIKGSDEVFTEQEIEGFAETAFNMLGNDRPENPVGHAVNGGEGRAPNDAETKQGDFSETEEGKNLAGVLGLSQAQPEQAPAQQ